MRRTFVIALLFPVLQAAGAQSPDTARVPASLANQLLSVTGMLGDNAVIVSGRLPTERMAPLIPPGATIVGGATFFAGKDTLHSVAIVSMTESRDQAKEIVHRHFQTRGWKEPDMSRFGGQSGGLVAIGVPMGETSAYCSDSASAGVSAVTAPNGGTFVRITVTRVLQSTICDMAVDREMMAGRDQIELPTLTPPAGTRATSSGSGGGESDFRSHAGYTSTLTVEQMTAHFAPQLTQQGWTIGGRAALTPDLTVITARKADAKGRQLYLTLTDHRWSPRDHEVVLSVWRRPAR